jgi:hypothetical protein
MLDIVCWKWRPLVPNYRSQFGALQVNVLRAMIERHYRRPHRFSCITDDPTGIDPRVRVIPLWPDHAKMVSPHGRHNPSCYRRLRLFSDEAADLVGPRFVWMDLDAVIVGDLAPIFDRPEDFVMWEGTAGRNHFNGSMVMMTAGARRQVWDSFHPVESPAAASAAGFVGSDQAHICNTLPATEARWTAADDGVYSWRNHIRFKPAALPENARLVFFHGASGDPWSARVQARAPWVKEHWRE